MKCKVSTCPVYLNESEVESFMQTYYKDGYTLKTVVIAPPAAFASTYYTFFWEKA
jgi:hypothetical protein